MRRPYTTYFPNQPANKLRKHRIARNMLVAVRYQASSRAGHRASVLALLRLRQDVPHREDSTRSEGVESSRSGVTPHRQQASSRSWPPASSPIIADDASPTFNCARPGSHAPARGIAPVREPDTRGNGGGFAPCEPLWRCVVGVSEPWMAQIPPLGRGEVSVQVGEAPRSQTTSMKTSTTGCCS